MRTRAIAFLAVASFVVSACGTLLYPERHGQRSGRVDPAVLLFDGAFLLLFIVPGIVAFGIDFHTGAIYLPSSRKVTTLHVDPAELDQARIEAIVRQETGHLVSLDDPRLQTRALGPGESPEEAVLALR